MKLKNVEKYYLYLYKGTRRRFFEKIWCKTRIYEFLC
jgi:hypothetical protein